MATGKAFARGCAADAHRVEEVVGGARVAHAELRRGGLGGADGRRRPGDERGGVRGGHR